MTKSIALCFCVAATILLIFMKSRYMEEDPYHACHRHLYYDIIHVYNTYVNTYVHIYILRVSCYVHSLKCT